MLRRRFRTLEAGGWEQALRDYILERLDTDEHRTSQGLGDASATQPILLERRHDLVTEPAPKGMVAIALGAAGRTLEGCTDA